MNEFLPIGDYGFHLWVAYGVVLVVLVWNVLVPLFRHRQIMRTVAGRRGGRNYSADIREKHKSPV
jgi:heme exporter protein CcmD